MKPVSCTPIRNKIASKSGFLPNLSASGYYEIEIYDAENWPHFKQLKELPVLELFAQENFLKDHVLLYFDQQNF